MNGHTWNVLCITEITVRIYFVQSWGWRLVEHTSVVLSAEELLKRARRVWKILWKVAKDQVVLSSAYHRHIISLTCINAYH